MKYDFHPFNSEDVVFQKDNKCVVKREVIPPEVLMQIRKDIAQHEGVPVDCVDPQFDGTFYCGYICLKIGDISRHTIDKITANEFNIHGGITYLKAEPDYRPKKPVRGVFSLFIEYTKFRIYRAFNKPKYIVIGFDCAHAVDLEDRSTKSFEVVYDKCVDAEKQIKEFDWLYKSLNEIDNKEKQSAKA